MDFETPVEISNEDGKKGFVNTLHVRSLIRTDSLRDDIPRISSDDAWIWLDSTTTMTADRERTTVQRLVKLYNKYGASFVCTLPDKPQFAMNTKELEALFDTVGLLVHL